jgi:hypothetical protein
MTRDDLLAAVAREFARRKFVAGLSVAFIRFLRAVGAVGRGYASLDDFLRDFPRQTTMAAGATANTLLVLPPGAARPVSLRPFYNDVERQFRAEEKRFDYPNCAPHATQAWGDYRAWLGALLALSDEDLRGLEADIIAFVLDTLPSHAIDPDALEPLEQRFTELLQGFGFGARTQQGEKEGAAFQGVLYAYIRADAPHLHLDISKVGAGSKRLQRVGDIDGWEGERLVLSVEVKHYTLTAQDVPDLAAFANEVASRKAMGIVAASAFTDEARTDLEGMGLRTLDTDFLIRLVALRDPLKQRAALAAFEYYVHHIEKNLPLIQRLKRFHAGERESVGSPDEPRRPTTLDLFAAQDSLFGA